MTKSLSFSFHFLIFEPRGSKFWYVTGNEQINRKKANYSNYFYCVCAMDGYFSTSINIEKLKIRDGKNNVQGDICGRRGFRKCMEHGCD